MASQSKISHSSGGWLTTTLAVLSWLAVLTLWGCTATVHVSPAQWGSLFGVVGLGFPFCVAALGATALLCLLLKPRLLWVHLLGLIGCFGALRDYCPINVSSPHPKGCIKVMTYNTSIWGNREKNDVGQYKLLRYVGKQRPDIVCFQEAVFNNTEEQDLVVKTLKQFGYQYKWIGMNGGNTLGVASLYPIAKFERLCASSSNGAAVFYIVLEQGDTVKVVNAHLESTHLTGENRKNFSQIVRNPEAADTVKGKFAMLRTLGHASKERAHQADTIARFLDHHAGEKIIVAGDFNDTPISYTHHAVCSRLTDAFRATANGIGRTFNRYGMYVRIDHIFCSDHWKPFATRVDDTVTFSDHYPVITYLKPQK